MLSIYLDQNKWIELAKANKTEGNPSSLRTLIESLSRLVSSGQIIVPISETHFMEAAKIRNSRQRQDLASIVNQISQGWFLASRESRIKHELNKALSDAFGEDNSESTTFRAFGKTILHAFGDYQFLARKIGRTPEYLQILDYLIPPSEGLKTLLLPVPEDDRERLNFLNSSRAKLQEIVDDIEKTRACLRSESKVMRNRIRSVVLFFRGKEKYLMHLIVWEKPKLILKT
jgi:hypothetical protein